MENGEKPMLLSLFLLSLEKKVGFFSTTVVAQAKRHESKRAKKKNMPSPSSTTAPSASNDDTDDSEAPSCRVCWVGELDELGGKLIAPCRCKGGCEFIHTR